MLKLVKTSVTAKTEQRVYRIGLDVLALQKLTTPEVRAVYSELESIRDALSRMLDNADGKHV